eukprot:CAMPEP_0117750120 /NCGR_PEP_ID=MMETSP0947-20121206/10165_1 /TAXON_ID=44440 /ORGANISM="Chattonella subsalsa, Strain CCMP2191" /LENGTH=190 /DNA_ID=CAMNT_0005568199 /DNA_START=54 /DNA_END=626 /DNA_ORIENTATION=+
MHSTSFLTGGQKNIAFCSDPATGNNLFVYGSLMSHDVLEILLGRVPETKVASIRGFHRKRIENEVFPAMVPFEGKSVKGLLLKGINQLEQEIIDVFEEDMYDKMIVEAEEEKSGTTTQALAYVWNFTRSSCKLYGTWDYGEHFIPNLSSYKEMCEDFMQNDHDIQDIFEQYGGSCGGLHDLGAGDTQIEN